MSSKGQYPSGFNNTVLKPLMAPSPEELAQLQTVGLWPSLGQLGSQQQKFVVTITAAEAFDVIPVGNILFNLNGVIDSLIMFLPDFCISAGVAVSVDNADVMAPYETSPLPFTDTSNTYFSPGQELAAIYGDAISQQVSLNRYNVQISGNPVSTGGPGYAYFNLGISVSQKVVITAFSIASGAVPVLVTIQYHYVPGGR